MAKYNGLERRKHPRASFNFVINYRLKETLDSYDLTQTKDVSQGGVLLTTNKPLKKGAKLAMNLRIPLVPQKIALKGEVVDSREVVRNLVYETRVVFIGLDKNFFKKLGEFIKENLK